MSKDQYIAEYKRPKQRMTRHYGYVIKAQTPPKDQEGVKRYSVQRKYYDEEVGYGNGTYDLSYGEAVAHFNDVVARDLSNYPPSTNEEG